MRYILFFIAVIWSSINMASPEKILVTELSDDAFILKSIGYGTNIGLFKTKNGVVLLDPMPGNENLDALSNAVKDLFGDSVKYILNTHSHDDHSGGNDFFTDNGSVLLDDADNLTEIEEFLASSHSPMDKIYFHGKSNSIFVGDIYDTSWHPTFYAGGLSGFNNAIEIILKVGNEESIIVPGHGNPTRKAEMRSFKENTLDWVSRVRKLKGDGMTVGEIKDDAQIMNIFGKFNIENKNDFMPEKSFVRFIERTLAVVDKPSVIFESKQK